MGEFPEGRENKMKKRFAGANLNIFADSRGSRK
jgi:hypothetical protein